MMGNAKKRDGRRLQPDTTARVSLSTLADSALRRFCPALLVTLAVALAGCAGWFPTTKGYRQLVDGWIGSGGNELIARWGVPTGERATDNGGKIYEYDQHRTYTVRGGTTPERLLVGGEYIWVDVPQPDSVKSTWCRTDFYLDARDIITGSSFVGPDCTAFEKKAD